MLDLKPTVFRAVLAGHEFYLEERPPNGWAVCRFGTCLDKNTFEFDHEPLQSSRTEDWKATHRFPTVEEASEFVEANVDKIVW